MRTFKFEDIRNTAITFKETAFILSAIDEAKIYLSVQGSDRICLYYDNGVLAEDDYSLFLKFRSDVKK